MTNIFDQLSDLNAQEETVCPKCGYEWSTRVRHPRKCPNCQVNLYKAREPWPAGYEVLSAFDYRSAKWASAK